jgi:transcriptional regulator with XRE-family HTH domain
VKAAREARGLTQTAVAQAVGCSVTQISRIESGERTTPKPGLVEGLAEVLLLDPIQLFLASRTLPPKLVADLANPSFALAIGDGQSLPRETGWILRRRHIQLLVAEGFPEPERLPVSPSAIARRRGLDVVVQDGEMWAAVNGLRLTGRGESDEVKRFAVAHALGHVILEDRPTCDWGSLGEEELEANAFASYLLLPAQLLRAVVFSLVLPTLDVWTEGTGALLEGAARRSGVPTWLLVRRVAEDGLLAHLSEVGDL